MFTMFLKVLQNQPNKHQVNFLAYKNEVQKSADSVRDIMIRASVSLIEYKMLSSCFYYRVFKFMLLLS